MHYAYIGLTYKSTRLDAKIIYRYRVSYAYIPVLILNSTQIRGTKQSLCIKKRIFFKEEFSLANRKEKI
jgi:hypothetical protein